MVFVVKHHAHGALDIEGRIRRVVRELPRHAVRLAQEKPRAVAHRHGLASPYIINDDVRQPLFWMARWLDPGLYPSDLLTRYAAAYVPAGVKALYFLAAKGLGVGPILFSCHGKFSSDGARTHC